MRPCPFCDLDAEKTRIVRESDLSVVILSNPRLLEGHTLVLPKRHIEEPWQLTVAETTDIFELIWWAEAKLLAGPAAGVDIRQNYRPFLPEGSVKVNHVHFHLVPRTNEDKLYQQSMRFEEFHDLSPEEQERVMKQYQS